MHVGWRDNHASMKGPVNPGLMLHLFILFLFCFTKQMQSK